MLLVMVAAKAQEFNKVPMAWKWINEKEVLFTYNGIYTDSTAFVVNAKTGKQRTGVTAPARYSIPPVIPERSQRSVYPPMFRIIGNHHYQCTFF